MAENEGYQLNNIIASYGLLLRQICINLVGQFSHD